MAYRQISGNVIINGENVVLNIELELITHTLQINTTPNDALVEVMIDGEWVQGNVHILPDGEYDYRVTKSGYHTETGTAVIAGQDKIINVTLNQITYTLTINTTPSDALVEVYFGGVWNSGKTHQLPDGTYNYRVSKEGYHTEEDSVTISGENKTINVELDLIVYLLTFNVTPNDATIVVNSEEWDTNSKYVVPGTYNYTITRQDYTTVNGSIEVTNKNETVNITMELTLYDVNITIEPEEATVEVYYNDQWNEGTFHQLPNGTYPYRAYVGEWIDEEE